MESYLEIPDAKERKTATDVVFDKLFEEISSIKLPPGTKLSELEVSRRFGVSRQPVRDAFSRLSNLDLLLVRPQRATEVRGFSIENINHIRFVRASVELECVRRACDVWDDTCSQIIQQNLDEQKAAIAAMTPDRFHSLDTQFHKLICELAGFPLAVNTISQCRQKIDRLCMLSLNRKDETDVLLEDHTQLVSALENHREDDAVAVARKHFSRLDEVIDEIHETHADYFE